MAGQTAFSFSKEYKKDLTREKSCLRRMRQDLFLSSEKKWIIAAGNTSAKKILLQSSAELLSLTYIYYTLFCPEWRKKYNNKI